MSLLNGNDAAKVPGGELKLYAKWTTTQYTVKYNINGGGVGQGGAASPYAETDWVRGAAKALKTAAALKWTKTSGFFRGWDTNIAGTTVVYSDGQSVSNLAAAGGTINLYAVWGVSATMPPMGVPSAPESSVYAVAAAAGAYHSFVLRSDGTLWGEEPVF